jgi:hypothetical protein
LAASSHETVRSNSAEGLSVPVQHQGQRLRSGGSISTS